MEIKMPLFKILLVRLIFRIGTSIAVGEGQVVVVNIASRKFAGSSL